MGVACGVCVGRELRQNSRDTSGNCDWKAPANRQSPSSYPELPQPSPQRQAPARYRTVRLPPSLRHGLDLALPICCCCRCCCRSGYVRFAGLACMRCPLVVLFRQKQGTLTVCRYVISPWLLSKSQQGQLRRRLHTAV